MPISKANKQKHASLVAFGASVRERRKALGYSQEAFGDACAIDRGHMGGIERGEHNLALLNILKIITCLRVKLPNFFKTAMI
jgi:transcriptional regulator with XRE-family HTH domain